MIAADAALPSATAQENCTQTVAIPRATVLPQADETVLLTSIGARARPPAVYGGGNPHILAEDYFDLSTRVAPALRRFMQF